MYRLYKNKKFKKSFAKVSRDKNFKESEFEHVLETLLLGKVLEPKYKDHKLNGEYLGYRECHVQNDVLLIYFYEKDMLVLILIDIGSHSDLF